MRSAGRRAHDHARRWPIARRVIAVIVFGVVVLALALVHRPSAAQGAAAQPLISEVACCPGSALAADEWVELYNPGDTALALDGWWLTVVTRELPLSGSIPAGGYLIVAASSSFLSLFPDCSATVVYSPATFRGELGELGGSVQLTYWPADGGPEVRMDSVSYGYNTSTCQHLPAPPRGQSLHRGDLVAAAPCDFHPGLPSPGGGPPPTPAPTPIASVGEVLFTEVSYQGDCGEEWVEVANVGARTVDLTGWRLRDNSASSALSLSLAAGQVAVLAGSGGSVNPLCPATVSRAAGACLGNGLADDGDSLVLEDAAGRAIDTMAYGTAAGSGTAADAGQTLARLVEESGTLAPWAAAEPGPGCLQPRTPVATTTPDPPTPAPTTTPVPSQGGEEHAVFLPVAWQRLGLPTAPTLLISEVLYDAVSDDGEEFVELRNYTDAPLSLAGMLLGDAEAPGDAEAMYAFPIGATVSARDVVVIARCAAGFSARFAAAPDYEFRAGTCPDSPAVPDLARAPGWGSSPFALADAGDEVVLRSAAGTVVDSVCYGSGDCAAVGLAGSARAGRPLSLHRVAGLDSDDMSLDFAYEAPSPGTALDLPSPPATVPLAPGWAGLYCFWGNLHAHTSASDGSGPAELAFARARAAGLRFFAVTDHDHSLRPLEWRHNVAAAAAATVDGAFAAVAGFEWSSPEQGHVSVIGGYELVSHDDPATDDLAGLYAWLALRPGLVAQFNHPGRGTSYGGLATAGESPVVRLQEVGNKGSGSRPDVYQEQLLASWRNGWPVAPTIGADTHDTAWGTGLVARTGVWCDALDVPSLIAALGQGRAFASEDANLAVGWRCDGVWMGSALPAGSPGACTAYYWDGDGEAATVAALDFDGALLLSWEAPAGEEHAFAWPAGAAGVWLKVTQPDGDLALSAPIWR